MGNPQAHSIRHRPRPNGRHLGIGQEETLSWVALGDRRANSPAGTSRSVFVLIWVSEVLMVLYSKVPECSLRGPEWLNRPALRGFHKGLCLC